MQVDTIDGGTIQDKGNTIQAIQQGDITIKNLQGFNTLDLKNTQIKIDNVISTNTDNNITISNGFFEAGVIKADSSQQNPNSASFANSITADNTKLYIKKLEAHTNGRNDITISNSPYVKIDEMIAEAGSDRGAGTVNDIQINDSKAFTSMHIGSIKTFASNSSSNQNSNVRVENLISHRSSTGLPSAVIGSIETKAEGNDVVANTNVSAVELRVGRMTSIGNGSQATIFGINTEVGNVASSNGAQASVQGRFRLKIGIVEADNARNDIGGRAVQVENLRAVNKGENYINAFPDVSLKSAIAETEGENSISGGRIFIQTVEAKQGGSNGFSMPSGGSIPASQRGPVLMANTIKASGENSTNTAIIGFGGLIVIDTLRAEDKGVNSFSSRADGKYGVPHDVIIKKSYSTQNEGKILIDLDGDISLESKEVYGKSIVDAYGEQFRRLHGGNLLQLSHFKFEKNSPIVRDVLTIKGLAVGDISTGFDKVAILTKNSAFVGGIALSDNRLVMEQGAKLLIDKPIQDFSELTLKEARFVGTGADILMLKNTTIDLASMGESDRKDFRLLSVGLQYGAMVSRGLAGANGLFSVLVNTSASGANQLGGVSASNDFDLYGYAYSDRVVVHEVQDTSKPLKQYIQVLAAENTDYTTIAYQGGGTDTEGNIAVFSVKNDQGKALIDLEAKSILQGYDEIRTTLTSTTTDAYGKTNTGSQDYTTYFIQSMGNQGASLANQKAAAVALGANYELYLANLNSLNKRMGELRENTGAQGVWARVFNGMQSTSFSNALNTRSIYTTLQGGYDYTFGFKGASNYLGFALSYANAMGSSQGALDYNGLFKGLRHTNSNAVEFAIYNAYVQDGASKSTGWKNGFYSDSILKLSYIMSNLHFLDQGEKTYNTSNLAFSLSQELGYRFLLGADKEFYIDPQVEMTLGFLNQGNLKQTLGGHFMDSVQDAILTLRNRVGSSFGYKFDKFTQNKGFNSSLYLGTYFVSDVILGGEVSINTNANKPLEIKPLTSDMRFVLNLGTNFKIKDNTRIYFDFERSFGGKITTDYQLNLGVRYSFGTSKYTPYTETTQEAPKDNNTLKEVEPTKGYYIELLEKEDKKLSSKELKTLQNLKEELRIQTKTQNNKTLKAYLAGPYKDEKKAKEAKSKLEGIIKELKGKGSILEVE